MIMTFEKGKRQTIAFHAGQATEFAVRYSQLATDPYGSCFSYSRHRLERMLQRYLPAQGEGRGVLDVGCGTGHYLAELRRRGFDAVGIDGSEAMITEARRNDPGSVLVRADVEALPFASASFDCVVCIEVLRYLPVSGYCLAEIARVLKPGGVCLATATPLLNLNGYWVVNRVAHLLGIPGFVRLKQYFHTARGLRRHLTSVGFGVVEIHGVYLGPVNWVGRLVPSWLPVFLRKWERIDAVFADCAFLREFANMFLVSAIRKASR
jgi:ubiquinone/menaquinone biosynthesis C-methylase UbiE